jgi:hypothetical protein
MFKELTDGLLSIHPVWARREGFYLSKDFQELIARCQVQGMGIHGLEVFTPLGELLDVVFPVDGTGRDLAWAEEVLLKWSESEVLLSGSLYRLDEGDQENQTVVDLADALDAFLAGKVKS